MLTKDQWDAMTDQQRWDMAQSLMADVEATEAERDLREMRAAEDHLRKQWNSAGIKHEGKR